MKIREICHLLKVAAYAWLDNRAMRMGAALAYYSIFSIAPLVILAIAIASFVFGQHAAEHAVAGELRKTLGEQAAKAIGALVESAQASGSTTMATVLGAIMLFFGASGVFSELQDSLNTIWRVKPKPGREVWMIIRDRFLSFIMVVGAGFLLLVLLLITTVLAAMGKQLSTVLPGGIALWQGVNWLVSLAFITLVFALIYKWVPDVKVPWRDVWPGAALAGLLFVLGKYLLGLYLGLASTTSAYGAAGSLVVVLVWVYYSAQILLFGAEFTRACACHRGSCVTPADNAVAA